MLRRSLAGLVFLSCMALAGVANAGSYLDRASLLVSESAKAHRYLRKHLRDRELARLVRRAAEGRLEAAKTTLVPEAVVLAHPHLLLMLEHYERAAAAAESREFKQFYRLQKQALDEEQTFRGILRQLGWRLPDAGA